MVEKPERYHSCKAPLLRIVGSQYHTDIPNSEMEKRAHVTSDGEISGDSVLLGDPEPTFTGMSTPIVITPAWGVHCLVPNC